MKTVGDILIVGGILLMIYALFMDTSVAVDYPGGMPDRVVNFGLMAARQII